MSNETINMLLTTSKEKFEKNKQSALDILKWITGDLEQNNFKGAASKLNSLHEKINGGIAEESFIRGLNFVKKDI